MAISVTLKGDTYTYTVSNIQNAITMTPSNRNSRYGAVYTTKPTIKRNKSGSANSRWIFIWFGTSAEATPTPYALVTSWYVVYKAVFTKTGTTATVSEVYASDDIPLGYLAGRMAYSGFAKNTGKFLIGISTTSSHVDIWTSATNSSVLTMSGWNPTADIWGYSQPTISYQLSQSATGDPDPSIFGYIAGYAKASWSANGNVYWSFNYGSYVGNIVPNQTLTLSANGASNTSAAGTGSRSASLADKVLNAVSVTGTAKLTNVIGGTSTKTATATVQAYSPPIAKSLAIGRVTVNNEKHASMSIGWSVNELNKQSTASQSLIRSGAITCTWECEDLSNEGVLFSSGEFDIVSDGDAMTVLTDTTTATLVDTSGNGNDEYNPDKSFRFTAYITDRIGGNSLTIYAVLASEFYLICAKEGGRSIGFGMIPSNDGEFLVSNELRPQLSGVMSQGLGTCWSAATEDAPYGRNNIALGIGSDGNNKGIWCSEYNGVAGHWMIHETEAGEAILNKFYPVGSVVITSSNSSPASRFGGSWELFEKDFTYSWVTLGTGNFNSTNTTNGQGVVIRNAKTNEIRLLWNNKVAISDTAILIAAISHNTLGFSGAQHNFYGTVGADGLNAVGIARLAWNTSTGNLEIYVDDWVTRATSYPTSTGQTCWLSVVFDAHDYGSMNDAACNKFYWRRTS